MSDNPSISLTPEAYKMAHEIASANDEYQGKPLRVYIDGKGCDGFYYGVTFDHRQKDDLTFEQDNLEIIVDPDTHYFIDGSTIEWVDDERGRGFLVNNPKHKKYRGKFYRRKNFREAYEASKKDI